ncbi:hypothetical protein WJX73_002655 [Symbiochloris irregularis]|uniref:Uncharacterized protein n=1 Tax=Symbiochloris irregularis TaxID=706552 RepID=A0AAW1P5D1_9CHLO
MLLPNESLVYRRNRLWNPLPLSATLEVRDASGQTPRRLQLRVTAKSKPRFVDAKEDNAVKKAIHLADGRKTRPVNSKEAAKGKLDYVQVKDWGAGAPEDLGKLQVGSFTSDNIADTGQPFYELLARQLQQLEAKGALTSAQPQDSKPLPPFERWSMAATRYIQFLVDLHHVHAALEATIAAAPQIAAAKQYGQQESCRAALQSLRTASRSDARGWQKAVLRLIATAYCLYVTNLSMGARIGSAAAEKLNLFKADAIHTWRTFPEAAGRNPVMKFAEEVNAAGTVLSPQQRQMVVDELRAAMISTSLLLQTLAHED